MRITVESTTRTCFLNGVECRLWEGATERGQRVHCFIALVGADKSCDLSEFERDLKERRPPSAELAETVPARMIL